MCVSGPQFRAGRHEPPSSSQGVDAGSSHGPAVPGPGEVWLLELQPPCVGFISVVAAKEGNRRNDCLGSLCRVSDRTLGVADTEPYDDVSVGRPGEWDAHQDCHAPGTASSAWFRKGRETLYKAIAELEEP